MKNRPIHPEVIATAKQLIGDMFKARRESLGLTVRQVAALAGTTDHGLVVRLESGNANPTLEIFLGLCIAYQINPFFEYKEDSEIIRPAFGLDKLPEN